MGPFSLEEIQKSFDEEKLQDSDVVWKVGLKGWMPLSRLMNKSSLASEKSNPAVEIVKPNIKKKSQLKIWAFIPIFFMGVGFYFLYPTKSGPKLPFSQLDHKTYQKIDQELKNGKPVKDLILSKDSREIWLAISKKGTYFAQLNLKSVSGSIIGDREIIINSHSELMDNWARFYTFDLEKGTKIAQGYYSYTLTLTPKQEGKGLSYLFSKISPLFGELKTEETLTGTLFFSSDNKETFQKKLNDYKTKIKNEMERPIKEKMEKWQAYLSIINKIDIMLSDEIKTISKGSSIVLFEKKYTEFLGPMLSQIVIETKKMSTDLSRESKEKALEYEKLYLFGKEIGEATSSIALEIKKIKKFNDTQRTIFLNKVFNSFASLRNNVEIELPKIQNELDLINF